VSMSPSVRKAALSVHLTVSVGWIGAVIAYLVLSATAMTAEEAQTVRASWIAMDLLGWYVIVPLAVTSFLTGVLMALGTRWGLFRHYWVVFSFVLTTFAGVILVLHMPDISQLAAVARNADAAGSDGLNAHLSGRLREGDWLHPGLGLIVLLIVQVMNLYKPPGLTRYGRRSQRRERAAARSSV
jgi:hypothetical protein